jgi:ketosteroid isomerase-like protein
MPTDDLELLRDGFARLDADGYKAMFPLIHPEFVMETPAGLAAEPQRYEGVDGYKRWWTSFLEVMDTVTLEAGDIHELGGDKYAVETVMRAVGGSSGIETTQGVVMVVTLKDSLMIRIDFAISLEDAKAGKTA